VMGVSIALAILPRLEQGRTQAMLRNAALWRALRIVIVGVVINVLAACWLHGRHMRWPGVLQRIGVCFAAVAVLAIYGRQRGWWIAIGALLLGYTGLLLLDGTLDPWVNIVSRTDSAVFGHYVWSMNPVTGQGHDPEGLLSTLPAMATTLLGLQAGCWLRAGQIRRLLMAAAMALVAGALWSCWMPFNKNLWTPSFTLWTAGWAMLALAVFHQAIDVHGWPAWGRRFGVNAITAYAGSELMQIALPALRLKGPLFRDGFAQWITPLWGSRMASLAFAIVFVALWWLIVWVLDRRRCYLKI
jgi:predicted acyltransferase